MSELPESVAWFVRQLEGNRFTRTREEAGGMDSALITYRREPIEIHLVKDRSQWAVDLTVDGWPKHHQVVFPLFRGFGLSDVDEPT